MLQDALQAWSAHFDGPPEVVCRAPGRVNLIGEHTDYSDGFVFPAALNLQVVVVARRSTEDKFFSPQIRQGADRKTDGWRRYIFACRSALEERGHNAKPIEAVIVSNIPSGAGLSSSAALELAFLTAWNELEGLDLSPAGLAEIGWKAENEFVGVRCGRMDQMASAHGVEGSALFIDTRSLSVEAVKLPDTLCIVVCDTGKSRSLATGKYNDRVAECQIAVEAIQQIRPIKSLRDATLDDLARSKLPDVIRRRARHVITENQRVLRFRHALETNDLSLIGELSAESHESLKLDYEVSSPELDAMVRSARTAPGCASARLTGAGFGGCCVALVQKNSFEDFRATARASYEMYNFPTPHIFAASASRGASPVPKDLWRLEQ
jgi:galactokinase